VGAPIFRLSAEDTEQEKMFIALLMATRAQLGAVSRIEIDFLSTSEWKSLSSILAIAVGSEAQNCSTQDYKAQMTVFDRN
jgi:hypothetical protein